MCPSARCSVPSTSSCATPSTRCAGRRPTNGSPESSCTQRSPQAGLAQVQELRDAFAGLRAAGKFTTAFSDGYNNASYYLATGCDEILLQPTGEVGLVGLGRVPNFYKGALDKLGIEVQAEGRWEYKSAADQITRTRMSRPYRESTQRLLDSCFEQIVDGVVARTDRTDKAVRTLVDRGPFLDGEALDEGLVDALAVPRSSDRAGQDQSRTEGGVARPRRVPPPGQAPAGQGPPGHDRRHHRDRAHRRPPPRRRPPQRPLADGVRQGERRDPQGGQGQAGEGHRACASTAPAARPSLPRRSGARRSWPRRRASRSLCRWATSPRRAATTSPRRPTGSSPIRAPSPGRSA